MCYNQFIKKSLFILLISLVNRHYFNGHRLCEDDRRRLYSLNNSVTFNGKPIRSEEFLNRMIEALGIIIDSRPKERPRKMES